MTFNLKTCLLGATAGLMMSAGIALAQDSEDPDPSQVLATVNGVQITLAHVIAARSNLPAEYGQLPAALLFNGLLDQLVQQTLLGQSFQGELSLQSRTFLENEQRAIIAGEAIATFLSGEVDEATLRAAYEEQYPEVADELEYRASHILVETEEEAQDIIDEMGNGGVFSALAQERSTGPSAAVGGDLGWFGDGDMVAPFFEAVVALEPGGISPPVKTDFGWHVINLVETRAVQRPEFDAVRDALVDQMQQTMLEDHINALTADGNVNRADTSGIDPNIITRMDLLEN
ncbi:MAG: peptidylprolyl isomerase [Pseudomonadota bacterium]